MTARDFNIAFRDACAALVAAIFWGFGVAAVGRYVIKLPDDANLKYVFLLAAALIAAAMWRYRSRLPDPGSGYQPTWRNTIIWYSIMALAALAGVVWAAHS